jgi:hypothetical protein
MFPVVFTTIPIYKESYVVAFVDKVIGANESYNKFKKQLSYKILATVIPLFIIAFGVVNGYNY